MEEKEEIELLKKIAEWVLHPRTLQPKRRSRGLKYSRTLMKNGHGYSQLPELCRWIKYKGYTKEDVLGVFEEYKEKFEGQIGGGGLRRQAGGEAKFKKRKKELLKECFPF